MHSFVPLSLVATATLFSAVQGIEILKPASGDTVDATQGFDVVWTYDSSDFTNWEIELANPNPGKLVATGVTQASIAGTATSTFSYHVAAFTGVPDGSNYHVVLDPRNGGTGAFPESGEFTIVNGGAGSTTTTGSTTSTSGSTSSTGSTTSVGSVTSTGTSTSSTPPLSQTSTSSGSSTAVIISSSSPIIASSIPASTSTGSTTSVTGIPTSATVVPPISVSTGGSNSTITTSSTSFSTFVSGSVTSLIPQSTIVKTTVVPGGAATNTGTGKATSSPTIALAAGGSAVSSAGLLGSVIGAILGVFML